MSNSLVPHFALSLGFVANGTKHTDRALAQIVLADMSTKRIWKELISIDDRARRSNPAVVEPPELDERPASVVSCLHPLTGIALKDIETAPSLANALTNVRRLLGPRVVIMGQSIRASITALGLQHGKDYAALIDFDAMFAYKDPNFCSTSYFELSHLSKMAGITVDLPVGAPRDAMLMVELYRQYSASYNLEISDCATPEADPSVSIGALREKALSTLPEPTPAELLRFRYDGVCLAPHRSRCWCSLAHSTTGEPERRKKTRTRGKGGKGAAADDSATSSPAPTGSSTAVGPPPVSVTVGGRSSSPATGRAAKQSTEGKTTLGPAAAGAPSPPPQKQGSPVSVGPVPPGALPGPTSSGKLGTKTPSVTVGGLQAGVAPFYPAAAGGPNPGPQQQRVRGPKQRAPTGSGSSLGDRQKSTSQPPTSATGTSAVSGPGGAVATAGMPPTGPGGTTANAYPGPGGVNPFAPGPGGMPMMGNPYWGQGMTPMGGMMVPGMGMGMGPGMGLPGPGGLPPNPNPTASASPSGAAASTAATPTPATGAGSAPAAAALTNQHQQYQQFLAAYHEHALIAFQTFQQRQAMMMGSTSAATPAGRTEPVAAGGPTAATQSNPAVSPTHVDPTAQTNTSSFVVTSTQEQPSVNDTEHLSNLVELLREDGRSPTAPIPAGGSSTMHADAAPWMPTQDPMFLPRAPTPPDAVASGPMPGGSTTSSGQQSQTAPGPNQSPWASPSQPSGSRGNNQQW